MADYGIRKYDSFTGRFITADVLFEKYPAWNPYHYSVNNPITFRDGNGYEHYVSTSGEMIDREVKDADDPTVYLVSNGKDKPIGKIGGEISIEVILSNILKMNAEEAKGMNIEDYFHAVKTGGKWDLKNNNETIFGLAWRLRKEKGNTVFFTSDKKFRNASDVGNYHAGFTGRFTYGGYGMPHLMLMYGAGAAETYKDGRKGEIINVLNQINQMRTFSFPFGDESDDAINNFRGMIDADQSK